MSWCWEARLHTPRPEALSRQRLGLGAWALAGADSSLRTPAPDHFLASDFSPNHLNLCPTACKTLYPVNKNGLRVSPDPAGNLPRETRQLSASVSPRDTAAPYADLIPWTHCETQGRGQETLYVRTGH